MSASHNESLFIGFQLPNSTRDLASDPVCPTHQTCGPFACFPESIDGILRSYLKAYTSNWTRIIMTTNKRKDFDQPELNGKTTRVPSTL
ncbi:hypothetical protein IAQ61_010977 [Plenodomus lingam]|uniref:uncharacterized protein n=1 Tax=Leptosphaeria maculans TaxID=5022 RepID=UPI0033278895|nr:hypothetical protein IAQ61_010977 [Plenodomus lingam]